MKTTKKLLSILIIFISLMMLCSCASEKSQTKEETKKTYEGATLITLNGDSATINGVAIEEVDYTWHVDPSVAHDEVKNAPAEYYTGTEYSGDAIAYIDHELYYYPVLEESDFVLKTYDDEPEWLYYYHDGVNNDYVFATLPNLGNSLPTYMMHTEEEAAENKVLHITAPGTYVLEGTWNGQLWFDFGDKDETFVDENAKVTVILNGVDITCSVAPGIVFYSVYECDNTWEERDSYSEIVDTTNAGVNVIVADGSTNTVTGENVYRMLKTKYKDETSTAEVKVQKKMRKMDAAFYSYVSMNITGEENNSGTLTVNSTFEGLDSELHLTFNGGNVVINSDDDGMNVNEDDVSVLTINAGKITLNVANGAEGDGIDSNGYIVMNGGVIEVNNVRMPDSAFDSEKGFYYNGGEVYEDGKKVEYEVGSVNYERMNMGGGNFNPGNMPNGNFNPGDMKNDNFNPTETTFDIKEFKEKVAALSDDATMQDVMALLNVGNGKGGNMPNSDANAGASSKGDANQGEVPSGNFNPNETQDGKVNPMNTTFDIKEFKEKVAALDDNASLQDVMSLLGMGNMQGGNAPGNMPNGDFNPGNFQGGNAPGNMPNGGFGGQGPNGQPSNNSTAKQM